MARRVQRGVAPRQWNGNNTPNGTSPISDSVQTDFSGGGPIVRGRAWFFVAERYANRKDGISRDDRQLSILQALQPSFAPFDNDAKAWISFVNASAVLSPRHRISGFFQDDRRTQGQNFQNNGGNFDRGQFGGEATGVRLTSVWGDAITTRFLASYNNKGTNTDASIFDGLGSGPSRNVTSSVVPSAGRLQGTGTIAVLDNLPSRSLSPASKPTISGDITWYRSGRSFGSHEVQAGFYLQPHLRQKQTTINSNGGFTTENSCCATRPIPAAGFIPYHRVYVDTPSLVTSHIGAEDYAVYVQDSWRPGRTPDGVRRNARRLHRQPRSALRHRDIQRLEHRPAHWRHLRLTDNHRHIVRASWGRVYDIPNASYLGTGGIESRRLHATSTISIWTARSRRSSRRRRLGDLDQPEIDPDRHQGFIDEWIVGYRVQLPWQPSVDVSYIDRAYKDRPALVEQQRQLRRRRLQRLSRRGLQRDLPRDEQPLELVRLPRARTDGDEARRDAGRLLCDLHAGVAAHRRHVAAERSGVVHPAGRVRQRAGLGTVRGNTTNSLGGDTRNRMWQKHQLRTGVTWSAPWELDAVDKRVVPVGHADRSGHHEHRRRRSAVRSGDPAAVERTPRLESAGDDVAIRLRRSRRGAVVDTVAEHVEYSRGSFALSALDLRAAATGRVDRRLQRDQQRRRPAIRERRQSAQQPELRSADEPPAAAFGAGGGQAALLIRGEYGAATRSHGSAGVRSARGRIRSEVRPAS